MTAISGFPGEGDELHLCETWTVGEWVGSGAFGTVVAVTRPEISAVAKFVEKLPGAERELLFAELGDARNVVPRIDQGSYREYWVIVMPRADLSLADHVEQRVGSLSIEESIAILGDVADALVDLDGRVVHRDLKPSNILRLNGRWCLADFGIARYAEEATATHTHKGKKTPLYAAPEQWRGDRATELTDIYALGVVAYELLVGKPPFSARSRHELQEAHLHHPPPSIQGVPVRLANLVDQCLSKDPRNRPRAAKLRERLNSYDRSLLSAGMARLQEASNAQMRRRIEEDRQASHARTAAERRLDLYRDAKSSLGRIGSQVLEQILDSAPAAEIVKASGDSWSLELGKARLTFNATLDDQDVPWSKWRGSPFDVIAAAIFDITIPPNRIFFSGRSHSLWYGDIQNADQFGWYETAFMDTGSPLFHEENTHAPYALFPAARAAQALSNELAASQVAWPFTLLDPDNLDDFVDRWANWLGTAFEGLLNRPSRMPEREPTGSWRKH